jgi:hypothetical protein
MDEDIAATNFLQKNAIALLHLLRDMSAIALGRVFKPFDPPSQS